MGAWNASINGNDTAQDLRKEYQAAFFYNDVETALASSTIYEVYVEATFAPRWEGGANLNLCNLGFRASLCRFGLADAAAQNG